MGKTAWNFRDLKDQRFGRLKVTKRIENDKRGNTYWLCQCACGNITKVRGTHLTGGIKSCGCLRGRGNLGKPRIHGHCINGTETKTYQVWLWLHERCNNPNNHAYKDYGGRGIKVCERWRYFENFLRDMGEKPKGLTIERKNNDKGYSPDNCKWATRAVQARNRRSTKLSPLKIQVIKKLLKESRLTPKDIAEIFYVTRSMIYKIKNKRNWIDIIYEESA